MKKNLALLTGGYTGEHVVSLKSAAIVEKNLNRDKYNVYKIFVYPKEWYFKDENNEMFPVNLNDFSLELPDGKVTFDGVFNIIHGSPGEDGKLAGYLDMMQVPYTTCDVLTSAITMNKAYTKAILQDIQELKVAKSMQLMGYSPDLADEVLRHLSLPCFVKPNTGGSSIGMSKVKQPEEMDAALEKAFKEDSQVLVEEFVEGREFSIGIYRVNGVIKVLPATEIISSKEFFDFEAKYSPGVSEEITPGRMEEREVAKVNQIAEAVYARLNCKGAVRMDYFLEKQTGDFYFIEINTVPGQTETSLISQQVRAVGMTVSEFYDELIADMWG
jgi:D-alanine-D-alanine ligase